MYYFVGKSLSWVVDSFISFSKIIRFSLIGIVFSMQSLLCADEALNEAVSLDVPIQVEAQRQDTQSEIVVTEFYEEASEISDEALAQSQHISMRALKEHLPLVHLNRFARFQASQRQGFTDNLLAHLLMHDQMIQIIASNAENTRKILHSFVAHSDPSIGFNLRFYHLA
jgi:hypothetical protein